MNQDRLTLRTSISSQLMKSALFRGIIFSFPGIFGLLYGGIFANLSTLQTWGFTVFLLSITLITIGMLPYRHLARLQLKPNKLCLVHPHHLEFYSKERKLLTIPLQAITRTEFIDRKRDYGIAMWLKHKPHPVIVHQSRKEVNALRQQGQLIAGAELFFPYFNRHAYHTLMDWQKENGDD